VCLCSHYSLHFLHIVWYCVVLYCLDRRFRTLEYKGIPRVLEVFESSGEYNIGMSNDRAGLVAGCSYVIGMNTVLNLLRFVC
jgi:hypothetical protein